jgi:hypothetical protein
MKFKWRKWNRAIHRDLGYVFFAMTVIYSISGIAINHINDWNPNYEITYEQIVFDLPETNRPDKGQVLELLKTINEEDHYKKHYFPSSYELKIFINQGNVLIDLDTGEAYIEKIKRRPILHAMNYLHYNPGKWWTLFSDVFAGGLIILSFTGLFIIRGKNGIKRRGAVLTVLGIVLPVLYLILFY